jgi:tetratricopeptide (TPR) repeat protein
MTTRVGEIKGLTIPWLFQDLRTEKLTGTAVIARETAVKKVYFQNGDIIFAASNQSEDWLGEWLVRAGKLTREQCDLSSELVSKTGKKQGAHLVELGFITPQQLLEGVKFQVKQIIVDVFGWRDGSYIFDNSPLPLSDIIPLQMSTGNLIIEGVRDLDWKAVRKSLPPLKTIIRPAADPSSLFQSANLDQDQRTLLSLIDGEKSIEELCSLTGIGDFNTLKAIYALLALRMAETGEIKAEEEVKFAREAAREAVDAGENKPSEPLQSASSVTKEMIQHAYASMELQDHYEMLGVGRSATPVEIKKAYFNYAKLYHPDRHFDPEMNDMKEKLEALFARIHEAYETLSSKTVRDKYNLDLASGVRKHAPAAQARQEKPDNRDAAEAQYQEGLKQFNRGNFWGADEAFQWAIRLDPGNAEYVFRRGLTLSRVPRRGHEAEDYFVKAIEMAPKKIEYYLELSSLYMRTGLKAKALALLRDALKRDPLSPKINEAIKKAGG